MSASLIKRQYEAAEVFVSWLEQGILAEATGSELLEGDKDPRGRFWLGRLGPKAFVTKEGERGERFEPCAMGVRIRPAAEGPWPIQIQAGFYAWVREKEKNDGEFRWRKSQPIHQRLSVEVPKDVGTYNFGGEIFSQLMKQAGVPEGLSAEIRIDVGDDTEGFRHLEITLINISENEERDLAGSRIFECNLEISGIRLRPFMLEALPDSFRYDRSVFAWGLNCGATLSDDDVIRVGEMPAWSRMRPIYWRRDAADVNLSFDALEQDPVLRCTELVDAYENYAKEFWSDETLERRANAEVWSQQMRSESTEAKVALDEELRRLRHGIDLLTNNKDLRLSFSKMNRAMGLSARGKYLGWRAFQVGFLLSNLQAIADPNNDAETVDVVWFATGGGKTETYLGLLVTAALFDRMRGKITGVTAWSRFPLRMLSLQQTQRFANALAGAELVRRELKLPGDPFSLGFLVGQGGTPNRIVKESRNKGDVDADGLDASEFQVIEECPFCRSTDVSVTFDRRLWRLNHHCGNKECSWADGPLPLFVVDDEIWRFLPTIVVGTLDKAANISRQSSMRGLVGPPWAQCSRKGHGYSYASRSDRRNGCLVPDCAAVQEPLPMPTSLFAPTFRLQDELHLLRDSLGAVDAHYEGILDGLQLDLSGRRSKILASSATLAGYGKQVDVLYQRQARVFPQPSPSIGDGFWETDSSQMMRRYVAVAPRGVTVEFAVDRILVAFQRAVRRLLAEPNRVCEEIGIDPQFAPLLLNLFGTNVVYGNTLRDLDATMRSAETQLFEVGAVNVEALTGRTDFKKVRQTLGRLEKPESEFSDRLHLIPASSMMSHGVDIDRLNVMVMLGLPLSTGEFIQATARVGRRWPSLVVVVHKIGRERDASVYRTFPQYVAHGDRFVEPIPITRRSRRVLERTIAGLEFARLSQIHEQRLSALPGGPPALTMLKYLKQGLVADSALLAHDKKAIIRDLGIATDDHHMLDDIESWFRNFERNIKDPPTDAKFISQASPTGEAMRSLRDVEEQSPVSGEDPT